MTQEQERIRPGRPQLQSRGGAYIFTFAEAQVEMKVDHVETNDRKGGIFVEMTTSRITGKDDKDRAHLGHNRGNLLTSVGKGSFTRPLKDKYPGYEWGDFVEIVALAVTKEEREGEPAVPLLDIQMVNADARYALYPFVQIGQPNLFFGFGGSMKSFFAAWLLTKIATGMDGAEPMNILILDWESDGEDWRQRVEMISNGLGAGYPGNVYYRYCDKPLADEASELEAICFDLDIGMVIVDSVGWACGGDPVDTGITTRFFRALRTLRRTSILIAHQSADEQSKRPFGNQYWVNGPRAVFQVYASQEPGEPRVTLGIWDRKLSRGIKPKPFGYVADFVVANERKYTEGDRVSLRPGDLRDTGLEAKLPLPDRILSELRDGKLSVEEIAGRVEVTGPTVRTTLNRLRKRGLVFKVDDGQEWGLAVRETSDSPPP